MRVQSEVRYRPGHWNHPPSRRTTEETPRSIRSVEHDCQKTKLPLIALCSLSKLWAIWFHSPPEDRSRYWWFVRLCAVRQEVDALCFLMKRHQGLISSRKESLIADLSGQEENLTSAFVNGRGLLSTLKNSSTAVCPKAGYKKHSATHRTLLVVRTQNTSLPYGRSTCYRTTVHSTYAHGTPSVAVLGSCSETPLALSLPLSRTLTLISLFQTRNGRERFDPTLKSRTSVPFHL